MKLREVIVLAGGLGTRLKSEINDLPKCLAPVKGWPMLFYIINYLKSQGLNKFIFSLGYKSELVIDYVNNNHSDLNSIFAVETEPLFTGGAINFASKYCLEDDVLIVNADTFFDIDLELFYSCHLESHSNCSVALKKMNDFDRYGVINLIGNKVVSFEEKRHFENGLINGGIYILNLLNFKKHSFFISFSFEKEYLEKYTSIDQINGFEFDNFFIDIGVPGDYKFAQEASNFKI
jgi:D-glycero-alpha-D-manno-heptose 1-phosphate guanylyltransferase